MIVDVHTHYYDPYRPEGVPWPNAEDKVLYRTVLPDDYKALAVPKGVGGTIVVEASAWVEDNQWILDLAENEPFLLGLVGNLVPGTPEFAGYLERFASNPLFVGIRTSAWTNAQRTDAVTRDLGLLYEKGLALDVHPFPSNMREVAPFALQFPDLRIVVNHMGNLRITKEPLDADWVAGMRALADRPNVFCKISGQVEGAHVNPAPRDPAFYRKVLDVLWEVFGEDRLLYASNWPVCELFADYGTVQDLAGAFLDDKSVTAREKVLWKNSQAAYRWEPR